MSRPHLKTGGRYPVLRALGILYLFIAVGVLGVGLYWTFWAIVHSLGSFVEKAMLAAAALAVTFFAVVTVLAIAELIKLMIDIEHNTRVAATPKPEGDGTDDESAEAALIRGH